MASIDLPFDNRRKTYDRDKLATAVLVYLDVMGDAADTPTIHATKAAALVLRDEHGFDTDSITYAVGARICVERGTEP